MMPAAALSADAAAPAADPTAWPAVLLVDDDPSVLEILRDTIASEPYRVVTVDNPSKGLECLRREEFAIVISDHNMEGMSGLDFLGQAKRIQPDASKILLTGAFSLGLAIEAINRGDLYRFIAKPWVRAELLATLKNAASRYELVRDNRRLQEETEELNRKLQEANLALAGKVVELKEQKGAVEEAFVELKVNFDHSLEICHRMLTAFHPALGAATRGVVEVCRRLATSDKVSEAEGHTLIVSAWLHDIGLIAFPRRLWRKIHSPSEALTDDERNMYRSHPIHGQSLAAFVAKLKPVGETIRGHRERWDGKGFPDGLEGENIPWTARLLAVAVFFVECGLPNDKATEAVLARSGTWFDPEAVRLLLKVMPALELPRRQREVMLDDLRPGMSLAKGLYTPAGVLLFPEDQRLDESMISKIRKHHMNNSVRQQLLVYG